ncbi:hypothetical protein [Sporosarcina obsidiansis]|uniref:hypothetical protein n=1 Tax=Sporosarcina obsidiansis TaxID=2660748 RepID=UPI00129A4C87|nr:hypothetical protein [Sporosarcina obsidiansis]
MYDPTVFENLKVAFENRVYDLDNLERTINIVNRTDQLDVAVMSRKFTIRFSLVGQPAVIGEIVLHSSLQELADEILEVDGAEPGCLLSLRVLKNVQDLDTECEQIEQVLQAIWENDIDYRQTLSFQYNQTEPGFLNTITIVFKPKLTEDHMGEIGEFLEHVVEMLTRIGDL